MKNNGDFVVRQGPLSLRGAEYCPDEVNPFEYEGVDMFAVEADSQVTVYEKQTGCVMARGATQEEAQVLARHNINLITAEDTKAIIELALAYIAQGKEYNYETKTWHRLVMKYELPGETK